MSNLTNSNILVTGATGLVGSHLVEKLLTVKPFKLVALSRSADPDAYFFREKIDKRVTMAHGDLKDKERMFDIVTKYEINYIFHIAAQPIVPTAFLNPYETLATNIMGTVNILEAARLSPKIKGVIVASSDKAYGKDCVEVLENQALRGDHPYDVSKSCTDLIAQTYAKTYQLPVTISRFGNIFGPGDLNFNRILPGIMRSLFTNETLQLRSNGIFVRDYVYVKEVVNGYISLAMNIDKTKGEAFNFSTDFHLSVIELIEKVENTIRKKINYTIVNDQKNEIERQTLNADKARQILNWQTKHSFEEAILETYYWYREYFRKKIWIP